MNWKAEQAASNVVITVKQKQNIGQIMYTDNLPADNVTPDIAFTDEPVVQ